MMESLYRTPLRVYLILGILSIIGVVSATRLPVSLFPNSSKPIVHGCVKSELSSEAFLRYYGNDLESRFRGIKKSGLKVEKITSEYRAKDICYEVEFVWGGDPIEAAKEVEEIGRNFVASIDSTYDSSFNSWVRNDNTGFFALSFYSPQRSLIELYETIDPVLSPKLTRVNELASSYLYNPQSLEVAIELKPEAMASFGLFPHDVSRAILKTFDGFNGGSVTVADDNIRISYPKQVNRFEQLKEIAIPAEGSRSVTLGDVAKIDLAVPVDSTQIFKTSGAASIILWASPRPGGNVKEMADTIRRLVDESMKDLPKDIEYKILVDPSEFIGAAVTNVGHEVLLAAGLAVLILFFFIGSLKNVATAAVEIPLSLVLAFILMRISGMNLNLISLGGLALSAGMNVDASVVVMENIFRHFDLAKGRELDFEARVKLVVEAVKEVQFAVIASTIASLVVFIPLAFTSDLTYAILGDLAKAVVFSHGFSAIVALVLVPTIRLQLMKKGSFHEKPSLLEAPLQRLEARYAKALGAFLESKRLRNGSYAALALTLLLLVTVVVPRLPREVIGKPDTDWLELNINTQSNTLIRQMEAQSDAVENKLLEKFGDEILYTFTQIYRPNGAFIMFRLKDKSHMKDLLKRVEEEFQNTPEVTYNTDSWNPAELPLPNPPDFKVVIASGDTTSMADTARDISIELRERKIFERVNVEPRANKDETFVIRPRSEQWPYLAKNFSISDLADLTRTATEGKSIGNASFVDERGKEKSFNMRMHYPKEFVGNGEELGAMPIGLGSKIVPLKAFATVTQEEVRGVTVRENGQELFTVSARGKKDEQKQTDESVRKANELIENWPKIVEELEAKRLAMTGAAAGEQVASADGERDAEAALKAASKTTEKIVKPTIEVVDAKAELTSALRQLAIAVSLSILLIFITMVFQFGSLMNAVLVLVAIPLGFIGVAISLFVFQSTLSLNSMLGTILLNGLAVANSIILVDFLQRKVKEGLAPRLAAVEVARVRLRPILMTSLTTGLGMLPVALGMGEGGKILQPLGIAVAGGLGFSMVATLFVVPSLQVSWIEWSRARESRRV